MEMERVEVFEAINSERDYQDVKWGEGQEITAHDYQHSVADWILFQENKLQEAKDNLYNLNETAALRSMLKVVALGVACFEAKGVQSRQLN